MKATNEQTAGKTWSQFELDVEDIAQRQGARPEVGSPDGNALYVNGRLVCNWFTRGHADMLKACGVKVEFAHQCYKVFHHNWPKTLTAAMKLP